MQRNSIKKCQNFIEHNADAGALPIPAPIPGCIPGHGPQMLQGLCERKRERRAGQGRRFRWQFNIRTLI